jgi:four helix bundle protein
MAISTFEDLEVWREAHHLVLEVYRITDELPPSQKYGLAGQMQRAAVSIPANIAEGFERQSGLEKTRFYNIAQGSLEELRYYLILCRDLGYKLQFEVLNSDAQRIGRMLNGLIQSIRCRRP